MTIDFIYQLLQIDFFSHNVDLVGIDHQERGFHIIEEKIVERLIDLFKVSVFHDLLVIPSPFFDPGIQNIGVGLQKYDQIRFGDVDFYEVIDLLVQMEFMALQIEVGEQVVPLKQVIGDDHGTEQIPLQQLPALVVAVQ